VLADDEKKGQKMKNTKGTWIQMKNPLCRLQTIISQATGQKIKLEIARWKYEIEENNLEWFYSANQSQKFPERPKKFKNGPTNRMNNKFR
jgi:hypothetical protein